MSFFGRRRAARPLGSAMTQKNALISSMTKRLSSILYPGIDSLEQYVEWQLQVAQSRLGQRYPEVAETARQNAKEGRELSEKLRVWQDDAHNLLASVPTEDLEN